MLHLKELLKTHGWSQSQLADLLGRNRSAITHLMKGERQLKADEVVKIAKALQVSFAEVLGEIGQASHDIQKQNSTEAPKASPEVIEKIVEKTVIKEIPVEVPVRQNISLPFLRAPGTMLRRHPAIRRSDGGSYAFTLSQPPAGAQQVYEVQDREVDQLGVIPHDLAMIGPDVQEGDLVLVRNHTAEGTDYTLRLYQPPFLKSYSSVGERFGTLHEERASVEIAGAVCAILRLYRG
jgi:transcriptional regulator with XRE-family HTH domain